jgi:two-component system OmpR family sensor kinase
VLDGSVVDPERQITLIDGPPVVGLADEARLRQAIGNLLRNALVHTPPGTPVEVSVVALADSAEVIVADHGPGVPAEVSERVFERFFRADPGRSRDRGGSGLGLSVVAAVAEAHAGMVRVQETPGGGATFVLTVPLAPPLP